jgi:hypothetical protein
VLYDGDSFGGIDWILPRLKKIYNTIESVANNSSSTITFHISTTSRHILSISRSNFYPFDTLPSQKNFKMQFSTVTLTTLLALATSITAAPLGKRDEYYGVSVAVITSAGSDPNKVLEPTPIELNKLTVLGTIDAPASASGLILQQDIISGGLDLSKVQCRAYIDAAGTQPGSAVFNVETPAFLTTQVVEIGSILCYIAGEA